MSKVTAPARLAIVLSLIACGAPHEEIRPVWLHEPGALPTVVEPFPAGLAGQLVFQSDRDGHTKIYRLDLDPGRVTQLTYGPLWNDTHPRWSPDGLRIAFSSDREGQYDIYVMDADGGGIQRLTDDAAPEQAPDWAPDGRSILFTAERDGHGELYQVSLDSLEVERLTEGPHRAIMPAAAPDGRTVAYAAQFPLGFQIWTLDLPSGAHRRLTETGGACLPAWSPGGDRLAVVVIDPEPSRIEVIEVRSGERRQVVADERLWSYYPAWSPDGEHLAFSVSPEHHTGEDWDLAIHSLTEPGRFRRLTWGLGNDRHPHWRPVAGGDRP